MGRPWKEVKAMIHLKDREYVGLLTAILHAARMHAHEAARIRVAIQHNGGLFPDYPDIIESAGQAAIIVNIVDRHMPPKVRTAAKDKRRMRR